MNRLAAYNPGVMSSGVGNEVIGNEIHDAPHPGIMIYGNDHLNDHLIEYNDIYDICKMFSDLGAIYMNAGATRRNVAPSSGGTTSTTSARTSPVWKASTRTT